MALTVRACSRCGLAGHYAPRCPEQYATILVRESRQEPDTEPTSDFARLSAEYAAACERLADAWPDQAIGEHGYSEGARIANHLRIVAATVRGVAKRVTKGAE